ncbi:MAG: hypothetical protein Q9226_005568 [Calogaya cf. arnoldii]
MRSFLLITGLAARLAHASIDSLCGPPVTVTVTVGAASSSAPVATEPLAEPTSTVSSTSFLTSTRVITVGSQSTSEPAQPSSALDGPYSFAEENGSTIWLGGKTPTFGAAFVTNTLVLTLQPQRSSTGTVSFTTSSGTTLTSEDQTTTSWTTISSTSFYTHYLTNLVPTPKVSALPGNNGWNTTVTTLQALPSSDPSNDGWNTTVTALQALPSSDPGNNGWNTTVTTLQAFSRSGPSTASISVAPKRRVHPRQVGALVTAKINGVVVIWTNVWAGDPITTKPSAIPTAEPPIIPGYPWIPSPESVIPQTSSFLIEPGYTWDPSPASATPQTSSSPIAPGYTWNPSPESATSQTSSFRISIVESTPPFANATQTSPATTTPESTCGADTGRFTIDFDDLPHFSADAGNTDIPPIFNPYRKLYFNGGYGYVPPPDDPFAPISPPQLAVYNYPTDPSTSLSPNAGLELRGELGAGPRFHESAYWIDAYTAWIGCANGGSTDCRVNLIGYDALNSTIATQTILQPPCPGLVNCRLAQITFSDQFRDLAGLQILAVVDEVPVTFYMDDLSLGWSNNTCSAQLERSSSP